MLSAVLKPTRTFEVTRVPDGRVYRQHLHTAFSSRLNWIFMKFSARTPKVLLKQFLTLNKTELPQERVEFRKTVLGLAVAQEP